MQKEKITMLMGMAKRWCSRSLVTLLLHDSSPASYPNAGNAAVEVPTEILCAIFLLCIDDPVPPNGSQTHSPSWISITYVCRRWRAVAIDFQYLWSAITPELSPKWVLAFLSRSSHRSLHIHFNVGAVPKTSLSTRLKFGKKPFTVAFVPLPDKTIRKIFSHSSRIQKLQISGNGIDVIRILKSLDKPIPLDSLTIRVCDGHLYRGSRNITTFVIPQRFIGGSAHQLRHLHCLSSLHFTFPSWTLATITDLNVSMVFSPEKLFAVLCLMPQLGTLKVSSMHEYFHVFDRGIKPVHLRNLSLLVLETDSLDLYIALSTHLLLSSSVRRHFNFTLSADSLEGGLWNNVITSLEAITSNDPRGIQGLHFERQRETTCIRAWTILLESPPIGSRWPPLDDHFSLQVRSSCFDRCYPSSPIHEFTFRRLQELCVSLGRETAKYLSVEYNTDGPFNGSQTPHRCWRTLFSGLPNLKTLRFGDGAADLLISASCGTFSSPTKLSRRNFLNLRKVQVTRGTLRTRTLQRWISYIFTPPDNMGHRELRKHVKFLLMNQQRSGGPPRQGLCNSVDTQDVTESLLIFLLHWRSKKICVSELALPECERDELDALGLLETLLRMLDWEVVVEAQTVPQGRAVG